MNEDGSDASDASAMVLREKGVTDTLILVGIVSFTVSDSATMKLIVSFGRLAVDWPGYRLSARLVGCHERLISDKKHSHS